MALDGGAPDVARRYQEIIFFHQTILQYMSFLKQPHAMCRISEMPHVISLILNCFLMLISDMPIIRKLLCRPVELDIQGRFYSLLLSPRSKIETLTSGIYCSN